MDEPEPTGLLGPLSPRPPGQQTQQPGRALDVGGPVRWISPSPPREGRSTSPSVLRIGSILSAVPPAAGWPICVAVAPDGRRYVATQTAIYASGQGGLMSLLAGNTREAGFADGPDVHARFGSIFDMEYRYDGVLLVADGDNHCVRTIAVDDGTVDTLAGCPKRKGFQDGAARTARFNLPCGIAIDHRRGVVFVADRGNNRIRMVNFSGGNVSTAAGNGKAGLTDGHGLIATFHGPKGIAVDQEGSILVADVNNNCIRMLRQERGSAQTGMSVRTIVGASNGESGYVNGEGEAARFKKPCDIEGSCFSISVLLHCCARLATRRL